MIPFLMFLLESDEGKVKYLPLNGRGKQSDDFGRTPFLIRNVAVEKSVKKNLVGTHFCYKLVT